MIQVRIHALSHHYFVTSLIGVGVLISSSFCSSVLAGPPTPTGKNCVLFDPPLVVGTHFGPVTGQKPGDVVLKENDITVSLEEFQNQSGNLTFVEAYIDQTAMPTGNGPNIRTNNINLKFDFSAVGYDVVKIMFAFVDLGGAENLAIDGSPPYVGDISSAPSGLGTTLLVESVPIKGGVAGTVTIDGPVKASLMIGGQEFWIDAVCTMYK